MQQGDYAQIVQSWKHALETGVATHRNRPASMRTVSSYLYALGRVWDFAQESPSVEGLTAAMWESAISRVPHDRVNMQDRYALKSKMHDAICNFARYLKRLELKTEADVQAIQAIKPGRAYDPVTTILTWPELCDVLEVNRCWTDGRTAYDIQVTQIMVYTLAFAGLRREELVDLQLDDISLFRQEIHVRCGKGGKGRIVGIVPDLMEAIEVYLMHRPTGLGKGFILQSHPQASGVNITHSIVNKRIKSLSDKAISLARPLSQLPKVDKALVARLNLQTSVKELHRLVVTPHGLRRSCATILNTRGLSESEIQLVLGHADIKTTMGYILHKKQAVVDKMKHLR